MEQIAVSSPAERISERTVEQIVDISPGDDRGQGSSSSAGPADEDFPGVFRTFPHGKKVRSAGQVSADLPRHVSSSTPAAQPVSWWASLTPAQWAELEQARAEVRREHVSKRKRKKRRKRKTPKSSSSCGRARRRQWQWHVPGPCALQRQVPAVPRVHCVSLRHVVDVPVVRFVQFPLVLFFGFYACPVEKADWISSNDEVCADNYIYFRFKLKGKGRSEQLEVFLYGDKTIKVDRDSAEVLPRGVLPPGIGGVGFGSSPNLATDHTIYELCLPSERGLGISMDFQTFSSGKYSGTCVSTAPVVGLIVISFTVPLVGCTIDATATVVTTCSSTSGFPDSAAPSCCGGVCVAMSCGGPDGAYNSTWDRVRPISGKYTFNYFQYQDVVGCVCMLNDVQQH